MAGRVCVHSCGQQSSKRMADLWIYRVEIQSGLGENGQYISWMLTLCGFPHK